MGRHLNIRERETVSSQQSFHSSLSPHIMIKFYLLSLSVLAVYSAPAFNDYLDYLPASVKDFVEDTLQDGTEVLGEIQEDVEKEVLSKTSKHFDKISEKMSNTFDDLHGLVEKNDEIWEEYDISEADQAELDEKRTRLSKISLKMTRL